MVYREIVPLMTTELIRVECVSSPECEVLKRRQDHSRSTFELYLLRSREGVCFRSRRFLKIISMFKVKTTQ